MGGGVDEAKKTSSSSEVFKYSIMELLHIFNLTLGWSFLLFWCTGYGINERVQVTVNT